MNRLPSYFQLLEEKAFLLEKKAKVYQIIQATKRFLKKQPNCLTPDQKAAFFTLSKNIFQGFSDLEIPLSNAIEKRHVNWLNARLEKLNTWIAELQLIGEPEPGNRLHLSFLTRLTPAFISQNEAVLKTIKSLYLNARGVNETDPDLDNKLFCLPGNIDKLESLEILYARFNKLSQLPVAICHLKKLKELGVEYNQITHLPDEIGQLEALEELGLDRNKLIKLPDTIGDLSQLRILSVDGNKILFLPQSISRLSNLKILGANHNWLLELPAVSEMPKGIIFGFKGNLVALPKTLTTFCKQNKSVVDFTNCHASARLASIL